ncbi:MAG: MBL fold metallo-hydrolase [Desulfurococcales archaeon]|nr:MBL fold metallo-hydrolase [Desulfurococcales archaeon]
MQWPLRLGGRVSILLYPDLTGYPDSIVGFIGEEGECKVLIDAGSGSPLSNKLLLAGLIALGVKPGDVKYTVITHAHLPNAGGAYFTHFTLKAIVAARDPDASWIEKGDIERTSAREFNMPFNPAPVGLRLREGGLPGCSMIKVIPTPGHTPGSVSIAYHDVAKGTIVFVGDALGRLSRRWLSSEKEWLRSLDRILSLDPDVLCTSAQCMGKEAARRFLEEVHSRGPEWME